MEVKLGKPTLEAVGWSGEGAALVELAPGGVEESSEGYEEEWVDITVAVDLQPRPDRDWLAFWQDEDLSWPDHLVPPLLDGGTLIFEAREQELEEAGPPSRRALRRRIAPIVRTRSSRSLRRTSMSRMRPSRSHSRGYARQRSDASTRSSSDWPRR